MKVAANRAVRDPYKGEPQRSHRRRSGLTARSNREGLGAGPKPRSRGVARGWSLSGGRPGQLLTASGSARQECRGARFEEKAPKGESQERCRSETRSARFAEE
jgi:hypothetical protein